MQIPVYLVVKREEISKFQVAQLGFGFYPNGNVRLPSKIMPNAVAIVDDMYLPNFSKSAIEMLKGRLTTGCIFDFEREPTTQHKKLIASIPKVIALPAKFHEFAPNALPIVSCTEPCNHWKNFLQQAHRAFPKGWMLEITPWMRKVSGKATKSEGFLQNPICRYRQKDGEVLYFDTRQTITQKLNIAQNFGCRAAIALYEEVRKLI